MTYIKSKIGIGITTYNRNEVLKKTLDIITKYSPEDFQIVVVDDHSDIPVEQATYRFETNVGIATAKNKCLELLDDCEHIFLFDDDTYPLVENWWKPYVESKEPHLMYIFKTMLGETVNPDSLQLVYQSSDLMGYSHPRGCMLYLHHIVLDTIGGMETDFGKWGFEHVDLSNRIFNAKLTTCRFGDIPNSNELIFSMDENLEIVSTVPNAIRAKYIKQYRANFVRNFLTTKYCKYK